MASTRKKINYEQDLQKLPSHNFRLSSEVFDIPLSGQIGFDPVNKAIKLYDGINTQLIAEYNSGQGINLVNNIINLKLNNNSGLLSNTGTNNNELKINVDNNTLELVNNILQIKQSGYESIFNSLFDNKTTDDLEQGINNKYFSNTLARQAINSTTPINYDNSTGAISIQQANNSQSGYLSSTDWNTFNNKINSVNGKTGSSITLNLNEINIPVSSYSFNNQNLTDVNFLSASRLEVNNPSAGTDEKISRILTESSGKIIRFDIANDAYTATKPYLTVLRSGLNVNETKLYANNLIQLGVNTGNYVVLGDFDNSSSHSGNTSVAYGAETFRYNLGFRQWRDVSFNQIGARISSVSYNIYSSGSALDQSTALVFATSSTSGSTSGTFTDNSTDRMRITPEGSFEFGALTGSLSFFEIGKTKLPGAAHSDIFRVKHHTPLTDTVGDLRVMSSFGVQTGGNNIALSNIAIRHGNTLDWVTVSLGLGLTIDNTFNIWGGQLMMSNYNGLGGVAINHNVAQARLHVEAQEKYSSLFVTDYGNFGGISIVNKNATNSSFISFASIIGQDSAYIEKFPLTSIAHPGKMYIGNTDGEIAFLLKNFDTLKLNEKYVRIKTSPAVIGSGGLLLSNTTSDLEGHYSFKHYATYGTSLSLLQASMGFVENSTPDTWASEMLSFYYNNGSPYIHSLVPHYGTSFISNKYTVNATGKSLLSEVTANQDFATNIVRSQVLFPSFTSLVSHVTQGSENQAKTVIISEVTGSGSYLHLMTSDSYASGLTSGVKINPKATVLAPAFAVGVDNYNPLVKLHIKDTNNVVGFFEGTTNTGTGLLISNSHNEGSSFLSFGRTNGVLSGEAYISKFNPGHVNSNDFRLVNTEGSVSIFANSLRSVYTLNQKTTIGGSNSTYSSLSVVSSSETALNSSMVSNIFQISAGTLGSTASSILNLASFGFRSHNTTLLNIKAYRRSAGSDWNTAGVYFSYDVDSTENAQGSLFSMCGGRFGWNTLTSWSKFSIEGGQTIDAGLSIRSGDVTLNMTHASDNSGMIQVRSLGDSTSIGAGTYKLRINPDGGDVYLGHDLNSQIIFPDNVRLSNNFYLTPTTHVNPAMYLFNNLNVRYGVKLHYTADPFNSAVSGFGTLLFMSNQTNNWLGFGRSEETANTDSAYTLFGRFEVDGAFRLSNHPKNTIYTLGLGSTTQDYTPNSSNWFADGTTLLLNALNYSTIGFNDTGNRCDFIRVGGGVIELGFDGGWGNAKTLVSGALKRQTGGITGSYTLEDKYGYIICNNTSDITVTLPTAVGRGGEDHTITRNNTGQVTISPTGTETIGGASSQILSVQNTSITVYSDGANWLIK